MLISVDCQINWHLSETDNPKKESTRRRRILFSGDSLRSERLTAIEYEWVATVVERCCFVIFLIFFLFILIGINMYGFIHWWINEG
ncbi:unnamed protein product [Toxocara canis]|uniref:Ovule protein n=1 Tax=Toxocara canis TaxID=6265 RepID=A0A183U408_TOXCA|nr:unnamed protein product [Toxocara canis]